MLTKRKERWIPNYKGQYTISRKGEIRSVSRFVAGPFGSSRCIKGKRIHPCLGNHGYLVVNLRGKTRLVHQLLLETFVGPCPKGKEACHKNDIKTDNRLKNLYWGTSQDNSNDAVRNGRLPNSHPKARGERNHNNKLKEADVLLIRKLCSQGKPGTKVRLSRKFGVSQALIGQIVSRKTWKWL